MRNGYNSATVTLNGWPVSMSLIPYMTTSSLAGIVKFNSCVINTQILQPKHTFSNETVHFWTTSLIAIQEKLFKSECKISGISMLISTTMLHKLLQLDKHGWGWCNTFLKKSVPTNSMKTAKHIMSIVFLFSACQAGGWKTYNTATICIRWGEAGRDSSLSLYNVTLRTHGRNFQIIWQVPQLDLVTSVCIVFFMCMYAKVLSLHF